MRFLSWLIAITVPTILLLSVFVGLMTQRPKGALYVDLVFPQGFQGHVDILFEEPNGTLLDGDRKITLRIPPNGIVRVQNKSFKYDEGGVVLSAHADNGSPIPVQYLSLVQSFESYPPQRQRIWVFRSLGNISLFVGIPSEAKKVFLAFRTRNVPN
jgi:hypothetical protein